jgi:hypothetical protein
MGVRMIPSTNCQRKYRPAAIFPFALIGVLLSCHQHSSPPQQGRELSPAVKAAVTAALGPHTSNDDVTEFLRSAKLASRTRYDTEVVAMLDELVSLARSAAQDDYQAENYRHEATKTRGAVQWNEQMHEEDKQFCGTATDLEIIQSCKEGDHRIEAQRKEASVYTQRAQHFDDESRKNRERAASLMNALRAAVQ